MLRTILRRFGSSASALVPVSTPSESTRPRDSRRHARRPDVESLEGRRLMSVAAFVDSRRFIVRGDDSLNQITLNHVGSTTVASWSGGSASAPDSAFDSIYLSTGRAVNDYMLVLGSPAGKYLNISDQAGGALVRIGNGSVSTPLDQTILSNIFITSNQDDDIVLQILDDLDPFRRTVTFADGPAPSIGTISGLTPQPIQYSYRRVLEAGLDTGADATINVQQTGTFTRLLTSRYPGISSVNFGVQGSMRGIRAGVDITPQGLTDVAMSAVNDPFSPNVTITRNPVVNNPVYASDLIKGLAPGTISYSTAHVRSVSIQTSKAGANIGVQGLGADTYLVGNGNNTVTVGNRSTNSLFDANLRVVNVTGMTDIEVDWSALQPYSRNVRIGVPAPDGLSYLVDGLWSHSRFYRPSATSSLRIIGPGGTLLGGARAPVASPPTQAPTPPSSSNARTVTSPAKRTGPAHHTPSPTTTNRGHHAKTPLRHLKPRHSPVG